jgi:hypothetical protein
MWPRGNAEISSLQRGTKECAKYEAQPVINQQCIAECQLAAFNCGNAFTR